MLQRHAGFLANIVIRALWDYENCGKKKYAESSTLNEIYHILEGPFSFTSGCYTLNNSVWIERCYYNTFVTCDGFTCPSYGQPRAQETYLEMSERAMSGKKFSICQRIYSFELTVPTVMQHWGNNAKCCFTATAATRPALATDYIYHRIKQNVQQQAEHMVGVKRL